MRNLKVDVRAMIFEVVLYVILFLLGAGLVFVSGQELYKLILGRADYFIADVTLNGSLGSNVNAAHLTNLVRLRIAEIREDLKQAVELTKKGEADENLQQAAADQQRDRAVGPTDTAGTGGKEQKRERRVVQSSIPTHRNLKLPVWAHVAAPAVDNQLGDLKLNIGGLDLAGILTWLRSNVVGARTLRFIVTVNESSVTITGDIGMFDSRKRNLQIEVLKRQSPDEIVTFLVADKIACEIVRRQILGSDPRNIFQRMWNEQTPELMEKATLSEFESNDFRSALFMATSDYRAKRSPSANEALEEIRGQVDYARDYLSQLWESLKWSSDRPPDVKIQLLPDDASYAFVDYVANVADTAGEINYNPDSLQTIYAVSPRARFVPDKTFGSIAFTFVAALKGGALRQLGSLAWKQESGTILSSFVDILGAVVKKRWLREDKDGAHWPLVQEGGIDFRNGADLTSRSVATWKPLRSLKAPGSCENDHQISSWQLHRNGDDVIDGTHQNSGALNKAFYDASLKIGPECAVEIWLKGLRSVLPDNWNELKNRPLKVAQLVDAIRSQADDDKKSFVDEALKGVELLPAKAP